MTRSEWEDRWRKMSRVSRMVRLTYAKTFDEAMSGRGGFLQEGRWHSAGQAVVYTAASRSTCLVERLVHLEGTVEDAGPDLVYFDLSVPPSVSRAVFPPHYLQELLDDHPGPGVPPTWNVADHPLCRRLGDGWLAGRRTCLLIVPSAVVPGDANVLVNPMHPDMALIRDANPDFRTESFTWDERLAKVVNLADTGRRAAKT